jgi:hypothetical protein
MKSCPKCSEQHSKVGTFCSRVCANSRGPRGEDFKNKVSSKISSKLAGKPRKDKHVGKWAEVVGPYTKVYRCKCKITGKMFYSPKQNKKLAPDVELSVVQYRALCKFTFSKQEAPHLFNDDLINQFGWYAPSNSKSPNLQGVTWDHLFRIEEGFKLGVPPEVMSHPANAEMITWPENKARTVSQITLEELQQRIAQWT